MATPQYCSARDRLKSPAVLFICSGNICRSPMAEALAGPILKEAGVESSQLDSAGTLNIDGVPADTYAVACLGEWGIDLRSHRSTPLRKCDLTNYDAIVVMEPSHRKEILKVAPSLAEKVWCLWDYLEPAGIIDRIPDPIGTPLHTFRQCRDLIARCLRNWAVAFSETLKT